MRGGAFSDPPLPLPFQSPPPHVTSHGTKRGARDAPRRLGPSCLQLPSVSQSALASVFPLSSSLPLSLFPFSFPLLPSPSFPLLPSPPLPPSAFLSAPLPDLPPAFISRLRSPSQLNLHAHRALATLQDGITVWLYQTPPGSPVRRIRAVLRISAERNDCLGIYIFYISFIRIKYAV